MAVTPYKVLAAEQGGAELAVPTEVNLTASNVQYTPTAPVTADNVQDAVIQSTKINTTTFNTATAQISTTSTTFQTDASMTVTPAAGTWAIWYTGDVETTGVNCQGDIQMFVAGVGEGDTLRSIQASTALLGGIIISTVSVQSSIAFVDRYTFNGSQQLTIRYRVAPATAGQGSIVINARTMLLMQVGL